MNTDFDKSLQDLLCNHTEQPTSDCWDKILSRLDTLPPVDASSVSAGNSVSQFVGSVAGKIAITAAVAVSVGMAIYFAVKDGEKEELTAKKQEVIVTEQDTDLLYQDYAKAEVIKNEMKIVLSSDKITQSNDIISMDTATAEKIEEKITVFSPPITSSVNQPDMNLTAKEPTLQSQETVKQPYWIQSTQKEAVMESVKEVETVVKTEEETEAVKIPPIVIPNIFTPNGDGTNDCFVIENIEQISENQLDVYTKNGRVVHSKRFYDNRWDGRGLPDGVYFYIFRFTYEGEQFMRRGSVTIRR